MRCQALLAAVLVGLVAAQGDICFDDGDCFFKGGKCVKEKGKITGTCSGKGTTLSTVTTGPAPTATGSICFDDGDCFFKGGKCYKTGLLGHCGPK